MTKYKFLLRNLKFSFVFYLLATAPSVAQIVPDATLPINSLVTPIDSTNVIEGGTKAGTNLFHSFNQFSIPTGGTAYFNNALDIQNIFSRVTGGSVSNIDGILKANGTANLFLLNPHGIIFGSNAQLNIGGSFLGTTATSINFADGIPFSTTASQTAPLLTLSVPAGLQLGSARSAYPNVQNPGAIAVQGSNLSVQAGKTLALVGGDIAISGSDNPLATTFKAGGFPFIIINGNPVPTTPGGRIELGSVTQGNVTLTPTQDGFTLSYKDSQNFGNIQLSGGASIDTSGTGGGDIQIQSGTLQLREGSRLVSFNFGSLPGGNIVLNTSKSVELTGTGGYAEFLQQSNNTTLGLGSFTIKNGLFTLALGSGNAGNIEIKTEKFLAQNGAFAGSTSLSSGQSGNLTIDASDYIKLSGSVFFTGNRPESQGMAGNLTIQTQNLLLQEGASITAGTLGQGKSGNLSVNAEESVELIGGNPLSLPNIGIPFNTNLITLSTGIGDAGNLTITTRKLTVRDGAYISADTFSSGRGGNLEVRATDSLTVTGTPFVGSIPSFVSTRSVGSGEAGNLTINTDQLLVGNGAQVSVSSLGSGNAGKLEVIARLARLNNQGRLTAETTSGNSEEINLQIGNLQLRNHSQISATAGTLNSGRGNGGNIKLNLDTLVALENSQISANAFEGRGGNIEINTTGLFQSLDSKITASSQLGLNGEVKVNTPGVDPSSSLTQLPSKPVDVSGLIAQSCSAGGRGGSQLAVSGRGGLPANPTEVFNSATTLPDLGSSQATSASNRVSLQPPQTNSQPQLVEAQGWLVNQQGQVVLLAEPPLVTPHNGWQVASRCN